MEENAKEITIIPIEKLKHGEYYIGTSRNTHIALWDAEKRHFYYLRYKFNTWMEDWTLHIDDAQEHQDGFIPTAQIGIT